MIKVAITGNIASGKSQVEKILSLNGYMVFDTDEIAHELLNNITEFYGYDVFENGKINRKKLGNLVFNNPEAKLKLEQLIHPMIKNEILRIFEEHKAQEFIFISVPLLFETNFEKLFDKIILVSTTEENRIKRLMLRNSLSYNEAITRIKSQLPEKDKFDKSDFILHNNGDVDELIDKLTNICEKLKYNL